MNLDEEIERLSWVSIRQERYVKLADVRALLATAPRLPRKGRGAASDAERAPEEPAADADAA